MASRKTRLNRVCCGTPLVWAGPMVRVPRGNPAKWKTSRQLFHVRGVERFWHWEDQTRRLAEGYGRGH